LSDKLRSIIKSIRKARDIHDDDVRKLEKAHCNEMAALRRRRNRQQEKLKVRIVFGAC
jgi:hypothetical protein